jgi:hypothetical protein
MVGIVMNANQVASMLRLKIPVVAMLIIAMPIILMLMGVIIIAAI